MEKRNETIDILRGMGVILVIIGHLRHMIPGDSKTNLVIYSFHMPLFLLVSGYLFAATIDEDKRKGMISKKYVIRKYESIIRPYFIFSLLSLICTLPNEVYSAKDMLIGVLSGGGADMSRVDNIALWFLPMFFLAVVLFSAAYTISQKIGNDVCKQVAQGGSAILLTAIGYFIIQRRQLRYCFWSLDIAFLVQVFLYTGFIFFGFEKKETRDSTGLLLVKILTIALSGVVWWGTLHLNGHVDLNGRNIGNVFLYFVCGISGTLFFYSVCKYFIRYLPVVSTVLEWCGRNSLLIMGTHLPVGGIIYGGLSQYLPFGKYTWSSSVLGVVYIVMYDIIFAALLKYVLPHKDNRV